MIKSEFWKYDERADTRMSLKDRISLNYSVYKPNFTDAFLFITHLCTKYTYVESLSCKLFSTT